jgi:LacI family transcriptional regulator
MKEVAALAQVSIGTVSHVMAGVKRVSPATRARVEEAIRKLGYRPNQVARSLKSNKTRMVGMVISDITNPFFAEMVRGAEDAAMGRGYFLATFSTDDNPERERRIFEMLEMRRADGLLVVTALKRGAHRHVAEALRTGTPVVCLDRGPQDLATDTVMVDNAVGMAMAVNHLIERGYRRIAYLGGSPGMYIAPERLAGYRQAMRKAGLAPLEYRGDFRRETGYRIGLKILQETPRPEGLMVGNILMAAGVLEAMEELGLEAPRDLALASFGSVPILKGFQPHLTCVAQPTYRMGYDGANLLIDRLEGATADSGPVHLVLPCELVVGGSTPMRIPRKSRRAGEG